MGWGAGESKAQPASLVKDINTSPLPPQAFDNFQDTEGVGNLLYFVLDDGIHGKEIWKTDGTPAGTRLIKDICPGSCSPEPRHLTSSNGLLFFVATDTEHVWRLWRSDGTPQGTTIVTGVSMAGNNIFLVSSGGILYFPASDPDHGMELWATDGTAAGTRRVADIVPGPDSSDPSIMAAGGGSVLFSAVTADHGREPWLTDGTEARTRMLDDLRPGYQGSISLDLELKRTAAAAPWGGFVFTADGLEGEGIWATDGTAEGTLFLKDTNNTGPSSHYGMTAGNGRVVFAAVSPTSGTEPWVTDGTPEGTVLLKDIRPGAADSSPLEITAAGNRVFFRADDGEHGNELWATDGTPAGTNLVLDIHPFFMTSAFPEATGRYGLSSLGGRLVFFAYDSSSFRLWESDGTAAGTRPVAPQIGNWPHATSILLKDGYGIAGGRLFFRSGSAGTELWSTDATAAGPVQVKNGLQVSSAFQVHNGRISYRHSFEDFDGALLFQASNGSSGYELWRSDGTAAGTWQVKELEAGSFSSIPREFHPVTRGRVFLTNGGLAATDGTTAGTEVLLPFQAQTMETASWSNGILFLAANVDAPGLWTSDGTQAGTFRVVEIPRSSLSLPAQMTLSGGKLFFRLSQLWVSDGTPAGTNPIAGAGSFPVGLTDVDGTLFFKASSPTDGLELWKSDGTSGGTVLVKDILLGSMGSMGSQYWEPMAVLPNGRIVFAADDGATGGELWLSDGSAAGTVRVLDILPGAGGSEPRDLTRIGDQVYFSANDGVHGREPWVTDGTPQGTRMVRDIAPGPLSSAPVSFADIDSYALFSAFDENQGAELWRSDGTEIGTRRLQDIAAGPGSSSPTEFTSVGAKIFFTANDNVTGFELWAMPRTTVRSTFADVAYEYWAWGFVEALVRAGITRGCGEGQYCPLSKVTRAEMAIFLERGIHGGTFTPPPATGTVFTDVPASHWAAAWIEQFAADGITTGCAPNQYCPDNLVNRSEMAVFLLRAKHGAAYTPPPATGTVFTDVPAGYWAAAWIEQLAAEGITTGCAPNQYCPGSSVSRDQMAAFLVRAFGLQ